MIRTIEAAVIRLERVKGSVISTVDVFHDPKSLTQDHREVIYQYARTSTIYRGLYKKYGAENLKNISIRRIREVNKAKPGEEPNKFQRGIELADALLKQNELQEIQNQDMLQNIWNIEVVNITKHVHEIFEEVASWKYEEEGTETVLISELGGK